MLFRDEPFRDQGRRREMAAKLGTKPIAVLRNEANFTLCGRSSVVVGILDTVRLGDWSRGEDFVAAAGAVGLIAARIRPPMVWTASSVSDVPLCGGSISVDRFDAWPSDIRWDGDRRYPLTTGCNRFEPKVSLPGPPLYATLREGTRTLQEVRYHRKSNACWPARKTVAACAVGASLIPISR